MALKRIYRLPVNVRLVRPRAYNTAEFVLKVAVSSSKLSRFGLIVPKSVDKRAVIRNKLRRVFHACIREMIESVKPSNDILFVVRGSAKDTSEVELCRLIRGSLKQLDVLV